MQRAVRIRVVCEYPAQRSAANSAGAFRIQGRSGLRASRTIELPPPVSRLSLTFASCRYDRLEAIRDGEVTIEGVDLTCITLKSGRDVLREVLLEIRNARVQLHLAIVRVR